MAAIVFGHAHNRGYRKFCLCKKRERVYSGSDRTTLSYPYMSCACERVCVRVCVHAHACKAGWVTGWNFQKIPAEIILGHEHVFVCIRSQQMVKGCVFGGFDCEMCFVRVPVWLLWRHFFFLSMWGKKLQHSQCFGCVRSMHTGGYSGVWPSEECVYPWWWLRYNNVWLYQTVSMIVFGWKCVMCGCVCVYAIVTKTVFGSKCESALQRWQSWVFFVVI